MDFVKTMQLETAMMVGYVESSRISGDAYLSKWQHCLI